MRTSTLLPSIAALALAIPTPSRADLVAHWTLDEGTGTTATDISGNNRTGTIAGSTAWTTTDLPPVPAGTTAALDMDGIDDQVDIVGYKGVTGTQDRSITAWIKTRLTTPAQNKGIVSWGANVGTNKWTFRIQNSNGTAGTIRIECNGGFFVGNTVVTDGEWHHVAVTWANDGTPDITDSKLYVDAELDAELGSLSVPPSDSLSNPVNTTATADVRIGDDFQGTHNWDGWIDDVRIYDEAIDAVTVGELASGTAIITLFEADSEIVASGAPVVLSWDSDPSNESLEIDNGVGDVLGSTMTTVNPTADTTYTLSGTRGGTTLDREVTVLVEKPPVIEIFDLFGSADIFPGATVRLAWEVFGEASLDLNGTDVTDEGEAMVSPTETTTYTLTATNAWGSTTADVLVNVLPADNPDLSWTAAGLPDGNLAAWTPAINATGNDGIVFNNNTGGSVVTGASNFAGISQWVSNPGFNLFSNPADSWQDGLGNPATQTNVSWEMVFRPGDFTGTHVLFNTGGNGDGTAIVLTDNTLDFRFQDANTAAERVIVSTDLSAFGPETDFYHIVALCDVDTAAAGTGWLYVNGQLAAGPVTSTGTINDWDGGDLAELGKGNNIPTSTTFNPAAFTGDIALFNYYGGRLLSEALISEAYNTIAGDTGGLEITGIEYDGDASELRITFRSIPNRNYALDESLDLTSELGTGWQEVDDSIPSQGTATTVTISGVNLPDAGTPEKFYRVRPGEE